ncbi:LegC family aminotransferase [Saccharospirillum mangrovi]|uniref:LegC family aminotransferase n=1 Tax=Saccharospirillum mangrovi TaxID=2161747 RepID=UPI000D3D694D|nr:LegC family aminotransferase [Saccharospirillum mangrovi]
MSRFDSLFGFIRDHYRSDAAIPLHAPAFIGQEKTYVMDTLDSTFVSSVGAYVDQFEQRMAAYTGSARAVATVNGTAALQVALRIAGVSAGDYVITQPLTFIATCNAIAYCSATPIFIDVDRTTLGLSPQAMDEWLQQNAQLDDQGRCVHRADGRVIRACLPMHTFGHPCDLDGLMTVCSRWHLGLVEDAAEALGSRYRGQHAGTFGRLGTLSFNGNKILTTGGGGMILANEADGQRAKHLTTTAKVPHPYEYDHDELGYNFRLPNLNAALGCAQLEQLDVFLAEKRQLAAEYAEHLADSELTFVSEPPHCESNYWLNAVLCPNASARQALLEASNQSGIMMRPVWRLMNELTMYQQAPAGDLSEARWLADHLVNLPSGVRASIPSEAT